MLRRIAGSTTLALALLFAPAARAEVVEDGVANGRFAEFVGATETTFVSGSLQVEPGANEATVDVYVHDFASGFSASGWGKVPRPLAQLTAARASLSFDLADAPEFFLQACGVIDGAFRCDVATSGRVEVSLRRSGVKVHENGTSAVEYPDGSVRRVTLAGWTAQATARGSVLGVALPPETSAKIGRYHQRVVTIDVAP